MKLAHRTQRFSDVEAATRLVYAKTALMSFTAYGIYCTRSNPEFFFAGCGLQLHHVEKRVYEFMAQGTTRLFFYPMYQCIMDIKRMGRRGRATNCRVERTLYSQVE